MIQNIEKMLNINFEKQGSCKIVFYVISKVFLERR